MTVSPTLDKRFREAAAAAGLLDVAYDLADTPIGTLLVATTERGLCRISFDPQPDREAEWLAQAFGVQGAPSGEAGRPGPATVRRVLRRHAHLVRASRSTSGSRRRSAAPCSRSSPASPTARSRPTARSPAPPTAPRPPARSGTVMNRNPIPIVLPCHRVVGANGSLVGYGGGLERKEQLLKLEGALASTLI